MSMKEKADIVRRYGAKVVPAGCTNRMIKEGLEVLELCAREGVTNKGAIVQMVFRCMCDVGDLTAVDYEGNMPPSRDD